MNLNALEKKADFFNGLKTLFASLNVPVNYIDEKSIAPKEILSKTFKENIEAYQLMDDVFILGMVDNAAFEGKKSETIVGIEKGKKDYDGILLFGVTLKNRDKGLLPTRSQLSEITRAFNREFHYTPVVVVFKYEHYISIANAERITYKQEWREGEKTGKVSILRDINVNKPHTGHLKILQELTLSRTGKGAVNTFAALYTYWQSVFNVSILNKQFYKELSDWYFWALQEVAFPATNYASDKNSPLKEEERVKEHNAKNLIRMLTRLLFVWFVKEKNLIPEELFDETYIRDNLINGFEPRKKKGFDHKAQGGKYYRAILQNLFFATLNQTVGKREFRKDGQQMNVTNLMRYESYFKTHKAFIKLVEDVVPFMNGGLFECLDSPDPLLKGKRGGDVIIYEDGFSDRKDNSLCVPDYIFFGTEEHADLSGELGDKKQKDVTVNGLINILKSYKFTVTENTPIEEDIALDPELLGRVFENLLASYNPETKTTARKQTGSFYTPREIVNYMVDESLKAYLKQKLEPVGQAFLPVHETIYETVYETNNIKKTKRHLPHWHLNGFYYFITFRKKVTPPCLTETERKIVIDHIIKGNGTFYELVCTVVMPDHVHIILKPEGNYDLSMIMKGIKGASANLINKVNKTTGTVWQDESFDRIIRNEKEFFEKINYMYNNPIKKGMIEKTEDYTGWFLKSFLSDNYKEGQTDRQDRQTGMSVLPLSIENRLNDLFSYADNPNPFTEEETRILINAIDNCKIIDPACGSGAFPMGILHKLVHVLHKLDANNVLWKEVQRKKAIKETEEAFQIGNKEERENRLKEISDVFEHNSDDYGRKLYLIENCIYGVDIQPIATQISKLRFFISLIVDQKTDKTKDNFGIRPLPNLETKFVAANTLIGIEKPRGFLRNIELDKLEKSLKAVRHRLFSAKTPATKRKLRDEDQRLREELGKFLENAGWRNESAKQVASWDPYNQNVSSQFFDPEWMFGVTDGFDVVIGNPPYGIVFDAEFKLKYENAFPTFKRNNDIYVSFFECSIGILNSKGIISFITPNTYLNGDYFKALRKLFRERTKILEIIDFKNSKIFQDPTVFVGIATLQSIKMAKYPYRAVIKISNDDFSQTDILDCPISEVTDLPFKPGNLIFDNLTSNKGNFFRIEDNYYVKDVGFNYWSVGKGKKRDGNSIGDRVLYSGNRKNKKDKSFLKGKNIEKYSFSEPSNYLKHNYEEYLENGIDVFRYSADFLNVSPKIIYRQTANRIIGAIDYEGNLCDKTVHIIVPKKQSDFLLYILGLVNSTLFDYFYKYISQELEGRTFAQVKTVYIKQLPIILMADSIKLLIEQIVGYIIVLKKQKPDKTISFERIIDSMVYELYFPDEIKAANAEVLKHLTNLPELQDDWSDEKKIKTIEKVYQDLSDPKHPVAIAMERQKTVKEVRIIEGLDKGSQWGQT